MLTPPKASPRLSRTALLGICLPQRPGTGLGAPCNTNLELCGLPSLSAGVTNAYPDAGRTMLTLSLSSVLAAAITATTFRFTGCCKPG